MLGVMSFEGERPRRSRSLAALAAVSAAMLVAGGCGASRSPGGSDAPSRWAPGVISAIAAENFYGDVISQVGGPYVHVASILDNPNTDPHTFESSPSVAREVSAAQLIVQNGVGYDDFMTKIESASSRASRNVIVVQKLLGLATDTPNPHLWYDPNTMPAVAAAVSTALSALQPAHAAYFRAAEKNFVASLHPWLSAIAAFKAKYAGTTAATTEPVADYLLTAMGIDDLTPFRFQAAVMNGFDPSPQDISLESGFLSKHQAKVLLYNQQVVDALTTSIRQTAQKKGIPVVGVYETMPAPGYDYQSWMLAEVRAIQDAVANGTSTEHL